MDKTLLLERLQNERDQFENLLNRIGFARQLTMKGVSEHLSVKDLLADVLSREQFISDRLTEIVHGESYSPCTSYTALVNFQARYGYPDYESPLMEKETHSYLVVDKYKNIALDDIVEQELAAFANIVSAFQKLTYSQCLDHDLFQRIAEHTYKPCRRTRALIHHWLKRIAESK